MANDELIEKILRAPVYEVAIETPLDRAELLSSRLDNRIWIKREDLQPVFSFKLRGAYNKISRLGESERKAGVVAASAGNHAQGVALAATRLGVHSRIVMQRTTPQSKGEAVRRRGGDAVREGDSCEEEVARGGRRRAEEGVGVPGSKAKSPSRTSTRLRTVEELVKVAASTPSPRMDRARFLESDGTTAW